MISKELEDRLRAVISYGTRESFEIVGRAVLAEIDAAKPKARKADQWIIVDFLAEPHTKESAENLAAEFNKWQAEKNRFAAVYVTGTEGIGPE